MTRDTDSLCYIPFSSDQFPSSETNNNYNNITQMTTTNNSTPTNTFSSIESSGSDQQVDCSDFEVSEFFSFEQWSNEQQNYGYLGNEVVDFGATSHNQNEGDNMRNGGNGRERKKRIAFRMKSEIDVVGDGYKWRKYGKKMVKNSPNPRNYYRCSVDGCPVKKRVERDGFDKRYVITTYENYHNHETTH